MQNINLMKNYSRTELIEIYKTEVGRFEKTRDVQWKFNVTAWTLLVLAIKFKSENSALIDCCTIIVSSIAIFIGHLIFTWLIQNSLSSSKAIWNKIFDILNKYDDQDTTLIKIDTKKITENKKWRVTDSLWILFQMLVTSFLLAFFIKI